jgi:vacuolar-type H+-ATPase subunit B/Vma2
MIRNKKFIRTEKAVNNMILDYIGVKEINGSLIVVDGVENAFFEETVDIRLDDGSFRQGRIVQMEGSRVVIQVFEGSRGISLDNTRTRLRGRPMEMPLSPEILGRTFNGAGKPIDGLGAIFPEKSVNINGAPINPASRVYPKNYIHRYFFYRYADDPDSWSEAADFLRLRYEAQRVGSANCQPGFCNG